MGLRKAIASAIDAKKAKLNTPFSKYLAIANPSNGISFLIEVQFENLTLVIKFR